jgi:hypothetical protein
MATAKPPPMTNAPGRPPLYFAFFSGGVAWTLHLIISYLIAEFGCLSDAGQHRILGITVLAWSLFLLSAAMLTLAAAGVFVGWRAKRRLEALKTPSRSAFDQDAVDTEIHFARSGTIMSAIFILVIAFQTIPIFYYLHGC